MAFPLATYVFYAYILVPLLLTGYHKLYRKICPVFKCIKPLMACSREPECNVVLDCLQNCTRPNSPERQSAAALYHYVQFPQNPSLCQYHCFNTMITTSTAEDVLECMGRSDCLEPSPYSDACAPITQALPFDIIRPVIVGRWKKLYTNGWDVWPCQSTEFHAPHSTQVPPQPWMKSWPQSPRVYRMDLNWTTTTPENRPRFTFHMSNEMYPDKTWEFLSQPSQVNATLKTIAGMWGTLAHENWYLLDYDEDMQTILIHYCAYTMSIQSFDAMTMVLRKENSGEFTNEMAQTMERRAIELLGEKFGTLVRVMECNL